MDTAETERRAQLIVQFGKSGRVIGGSLYRMKIESIELLGERFANLRNKGVDAPTAFEACPELFECPIEDVNRRWAGIEQGELDPNPLVAARPDVLIADGVVGTFVEQIEGLGLNGTALLRANANFIRSDLSVLADKVECFLVHELDVRKIVEIDEKVLHCSVRKLESSLDALHTRRDWPTTQAELNAGNTGRLHLQVREAPGLASN